MDIQDGFVSETKVVVVCVVTFLVILLICVWIQARKGAKARSHNHIKHVYTTPRLRYAHFSKLQHHNRLLFPELLVAGAQEYHLKAGDAILIPTGWWHWVETMTSTIGVNFWIDAHLGTTPRLMANYTRDWPQTPDGWLNLINDETLSFWSESEQCCYVSTIRKISQKPIVNGLYVICLEAFDTGRHNKAVLREIAAEYVPKPHDRSEDPNFWISVGYHDTGLHYDDRDGILVVLHGEKKVRLFPPGSSKWLHPYPSKPDWATRNTNNYVYANESVVVPAENPSASPSQELYWIMYNTCNVANAFTVVDTMVGLFGYDRIVWGAKRTRDGRYRLELYIYFFLDTSKGHDALMPEARVREEISQMRDALDVYLNHDQSLPRGIPTENLMILSFNLYLDHPMIDDEFHLYYKRSEYGTSMTGYLGDGKVISTRGTDHEGLMYGSLCDHFVLKDAMQRTHCAEQITKKDTRLLNKLIKKYPCRMMFFWAKNGYVLIQFCTVSTELYLEFLRDYAYPEELIRFVSEDRSYNASHEIGFSINHNTGEIDRTAIYNIV